MKPVTNINVARNLPERTFYDMVDHKMPDGSIMHQPVVRPLVAVEQDDNAIIAFMDDDGIVKTVNYDEKGAYKTPL